jgi:diacylglycerol kinase family enzyme
LSLIALFQNIALIYNPCAGGLRGRGARLVGRVLAALHDGGHRATAFPTDGPGSAGDIAKARIHAGADLILALGGDGTLNEILPGIVHSGVPAGIVPAGTANVLARELGLGTDTLRVVRRLSELEPRRIALGLLRAEPGQNERYFALMTGVGFDAHIVYRLNLGLKSKMGEIAYFLAAARQFGRTLEQFEVEVDGIRRRCSFALATRVRNYAGHLEIAQKASLVKDDFEVVLFEGNSTWRHYLKYMTAILTGRTSSIQGISFARAKKLTLLAADDPRVYVQVDGEYAGRLPATVEIVPGALSLLMPPVYPRLR